ncbi:MAG TPA: 50S ribosomal protein L4 [Miltoncostaeaceae bacterium]|nr:50S ribosomal protein L4 [Miltoncostaeaceae bacterium]
MTPVPVPVLDADGLAAGTAALAAAVAETPIKQHLIHETVVAELAARRAGTASTKNRAAVRGGGAKPWRQKGTGRARQGSTRSPQWTGGGIVFGPTPRSYGGKVNRKVRQQAFRAALRAQVERGTAAIMDATGWEAPSTKRAAEYLRQAPEGLAARPLLVVVDDLQSVEARSFRNIEGVYILAGAELETVDVVAARGILVERSVWERLTGEPADVQAVTPAPTKKPAPKKQAPPKPKPARKASRKKAAEAEEAPAAEADETVAEQAPAEEPEVAVVEEAPAQAADAPAEDAAAEDAAAEGAPADEPAAEADEAPKKPARKASRKKAAADEAEEDAS